MLTVCQDLLPHKNTDWFCEMRLISNIHILRDAYKWLSCNLVFHTNLSSADQSTPCCSLIKQLHLLVTNNQSSVRLKMPQDESISVVHADELLKEYLTWRGFTSTLKVFDTERKYDKTKGYQV